MCDSTSPWSWITKLVKPRVMQKIKKMWWRVAVGRADDTYGVGIVILPYSTKLYSREHIDSRWNPLSTHQDCLRTVKRLFCESFKKFTLILHQVIGSIPTGKGRKVLGVSLWWYSTPWNIIAKMHYQDFYRGWFQDGDIVFCKSSLRMIPRRRFAETMSLSWNHPL